MDNETLKFFAKYCLEETSPRDFSDWAIYCLEKRLDSKNLRILASMFDAQYVIEIEPYFTKSLNDLNMNYPLAKDILPKYAKFIANQILKKEISPIEGCYEIYKVYRHLEHEPELTNWDYLHFKMHPETYENLVYKKNGTEYTDLWKTAIVEEAAKMIYGGKSTVLQVKDKELLDSLDNQDSFFSKLWKKIF